MGRSACCRNLIGKCFGKTNLAAYRMCLVGTRYLTHRIANGSFSTTVSILGGMHGAHVLPRVCRPLRTSALARTVSLVQHAGSGRLVFAVIPFTSTQEFGTRNAFTHTLSGA